MQRARAHWLPQLSDRRQVLSVGEGHGRFAAAFTRALPAAALTCVDASPRMIDRSRARVAPGPGASVEWITATLPAWQPPVNRFDAIVTCYFLDLFPPAELATVIDRLAAGATDTAVWVVVDFALPPHGLARLRARAIHALLYAFFRRTAGIPARALTPPDQRLIQAGFVLSGRQDFSWGLIRADLWTRTPAGTAEPLMRVRTVADTP